MFGGFDYYEDEDYAHIVDFTSKIFDNYDEIFEYIFNVDSIKIVELYVYLMLYYSIGYMELKLDNNNLDMYIDELKKIYGTKEEVFWYRGVSNFSYDLVPSMYRGIKNPHTYIDENYIIDRYAKITIDPSKSVNTKWTSNGLQYVFEKESVLWVDQAKIANQFTTSFNEEGCHYVDFTVKDPLWKQATSTLWFKVKNALPKIKSITLTSPQLSDNSNTIWFSSEVTW